MKVALCTPPPESRSALAEYVRALVPHLREHVDVDLFVPAGLEGSGTFGADELRPRDYDHVLYEVDDDPHCAFMARLVRLIGGIVVQHSWELPRMAVTLRPALGRGGLLGRWSAMLEGGLEEAVAYPDFLTGAAEAPRLALNRSVVRFGDAFVVHDERLKERILDDRNQLTPIALLPRSAPTDWSRLAAGYAECLAAFPPPRAAHKRLIVARAIAGERRRRIARAAGTDEQTHAELVRR